MEYQSDEVDELHILTLNFVASDSTGSDLLIMTLGMFTSYAATIWETLYNMSVDTRLARNGCQCITTLITGWMFYRFCFRRPSIYVANRLDTTM